MNPAEFQNAYFRSEAAHSLVQFAAVHNELAQRHLAQKLEAERHAQETQIQDLSETEISPKTRDPTDDNNEHPAHSGHRYHLQQLNDVKPGVRISEGPQAGQRLDIII